MASPQPYEDILEVATEEDDKAVLDFATEKKAAMLALIAPYAPS